MPITTTVRSMSATLVGVFFSGVTGFVLMEDVVRHGAPFTSKHLMTLAVLAGTVFFGHRWWTELTAWRLGTMLGCAVLFASGTTVCVLMSAGRNAEVVTVKSLAADFVNTARVSAQKDRDEARVRYQAALKAEEAECSDGSGSKCQAKRITRMVRRDEYDAAEAKLREQKPQQIANADIVAASHLFARLPFVTADAGAIEALLLLVQPFLLSLFCEVGAIVGFSIGLGHKALEQPSRKPTSVPETVPATVQAIPAPLAGEWTPVTVTRARELARQCEAERTLDALMRANRPLSNDELASSMGCSKAESSRRVSSLVQLGLASRQPSGRYVRISLRPMAMN